MKVHQNETEAERYARGKKKRVDSLSDEAINQISDQAIRCVDPKTQEVKLRCKLCRKREFRMISSFEKHIQDHKMGRITSGGDIGCDECDRTFNSTKRLDRHKITHQQKKDGEHECSRCEQKFSARTILQAHIRKCSGTPLASRENKGAEKRKATLKAKEILLRQARNMLDDDDDDDDDDDEDVEFDDVVEEENNESELVEAVEEIVLTEQADSSAANIAEEGEPMVAMQHDAGKEMEEGEGELKFIDKQGVVETAEVDAAQQEAALVALQVIQANQAENVANLQEIINDPQSSAALTYVMECVNQVVANEHILASTSVEVATTSQTAEEIVESSETITTTIPSTEEDEIKTVDQTAIYDDLPATQ